MVPCCCFSHSVVSMALEMNYFARRGAVFVLFSLFSYLFCVGEGRFNAFRTFRGEPVSSAGAAEELWFTQKLDHFNGADPREWKQVSRKWGGIQPALKLLFTDNNNNSVKFFFIYADMPPAHITTADL